jgi:hypothetical protein
VSENVTSGCAAPEFFLGAPENSVFGSAVSLPGNLFRKRLKILFDSPHFLRLKIRLKSRAVGPAPENLTRARSAPEFLH